MPYLGITKSVSKDVSFLLPINPSATSMECSTIGTTKIVPNRIAAKTETHNTTMVPYREPSNHPEAFEAKQISPTTTRNTTPASLT